MDLSEADDSRLPPLERYFRIMEMLAACPEGLALVEISRALMLPKATVHRLLAAMQKSDLVVLANTGRPKFLLTRRVRRLAYLSIDSNAVASFTETLLDDFSKRVGETCYLCRLEGATVRSIAISSPDATWRGYVLPGKELQSHATAGAKAIMAFQSDDIIERALAQGMPAFTRYTKTDRGSILEEYAAIRAARFATCIKEVEEELAAFAVPVELKVVGVQYSVGLLGPYSRIAGMIENDTRHELRRLGEAVQVILEKSLMGLAAEA
jgi:DNA-binding IclR family transcriptional regulator